MRFTGPFDMKACNVTKYSFYLVTVIFKMSSFIFQCSFLPRFSINIESRYENNAGTSDNVSEL